MMNDELVEKLKILPRNPGVYFHKNQSGEIIYVGKASILKNRVRHYFQNQRNKDAKTKALVAEIYDVDWIETDSEIDALFLEAEMVKRYMPRYNILLRDDKSLIYIRIDMDNDWPSVTFTRSPIDDGADYFGPYYNGFAVKKALRFLRKVFPYYIKPLRYAGVEKLDLDDHLGLSPSGMSSYEYKQNLRKLISYINGDKKSLINEIEKDMKSAALKHDFENAAILRNKLFNIKELQRRIVFGDSEFLNISKDHALNDLVELFNLKKTPVRIEGFDISHMSGTNVVASMVVFSNGVSNRSEYRKFKIKIDKNDDFYNMNETLTRRLSDKNLKSWGVPDLILIDGGKGQLEAAIDSRLKMNMSSIPFVGLAKKQEQIIVRDLSVSKVKVESLGGYLELSDKFTVINLPESSHVIKLFQRIRDESHRFAVSYHTVLKRASMKDSVLDEIRGVGPKTKATLIKNFGSIAGIRKARLEEIEKIIGPSKAKIIKTFIK